MGLKVKFGGEYTALRNIDLVDGAIEAGDAFYLIDASTEGKVLSLGISTPGGVQKVGFRLAYKPKNKAELRQMIKGMAIPYMPNVKNIYVVNQSQKGYTIKDLFKNEANYENTKYNNDEAELVYKLQAGKWNALLVAEAQEGIKSEFIKVSKELDYPCMIHENPAFTALIALTRMNKEMKDGAKKAIEKHFS